MASNGRNLILFWISWSIIVISPSYSVTTTNTLLQGQQFKDWEQLVSDDKTFVLGFFSPSTTSKNRYLGIWFNERVFPDYSIRRNLVVWVANRNSPISDSSGILMIDEFGKLKISHSGGSPLVLSSVQVVSKISATLFDSGNFVLRELNTDGTVKRVLWQSFDYPTDTLLPGMKLGINFKTGQSWSLTSWIGEENPAAGSFTIGGDPNGTSQLIVWWRGDVYWTSGPWQNGHFEFAPQLSIEHKDFSYISNENEKYFIFFVNSNRNPSSYTIGWTGLLLENGGVGRFGRCTIEKDNLGCVRQKPPDCRKSNYWVEIKKGFVFTDGFKFDDSHNLSLFDCQEKCWANCSCIAYASTYNNQTGCEIWSRGMDFSEIDSTSSRDVNFIFYPKAKWWIWLIIAISGVVVMAVMLILFFLYYFMRKKHRVAEQTDTELEMLLYELGAPTHYGRAGRKNMPEKERNKSQELQFFSYESMASATNGFSNRNKLGEGGFGPVFKGKLHDGQEVAIKRLSRNSGQGVVEFKNEALLIAKLQHTNLVRLLGCCIQKEEKLLVYEYMPNKSLDFFLFGSDKNNALDWKKRFHIIEGIAQGLLYLHKYSRLRIIHRDLKASNILLDNEMNPKISDFGMARIVVPNECQTNTKRIVGTYGYMPPEYAMEGIFSIKSDVFSFGVMLLEIVSGRKNNSFHSSDGPINLIGYAWELWREDRGLELVDSKLGDTYQNNEVLRCIHVGLLCVQDNPVDRPSMLDIISMIYNEAYQLPTPKQPAFYKAMDLLEAQFAECKAENCSLNEASISDMEAR